MSPILAPLVNARNDLLKVPYAAIDTEYKQNYGNASKPYTFFTASVVDSDGKIENGHIMDFQGYPQPEKELAKWLMEKMLKYQLTIGWYSKGISLQREDGTFEGKDSDLKVLDSVCRYYNIPSIILFDRRGVPYVSGHDRYLRKIDPYYAGLNKFTYYSHIDLYRVYSKPLVKSIIYENKYKDLNLNSVCKAIVGEGKYQGFDGLQIQKLSTKEQLEYVAQDAKLVMMLSKHNNFEILDLMNAISHITGVLFEKVCHTGISGVIMATAGLIAGVLQLSRIVRVYELLFGPATRWYDKALAIDPNDVNALDNKAYTISNLADVEKVIEGYDKAIELVDKAIAIDPSYANAWYNKSCYTAIKGNKEQALKSLEQCIKLDKKYIELAKVDKDFDKIKDDIKFKKLIKTEQ